MVGGERSIPRHDGQTLRTEYAAATRSSPNMLGLISWNEFSENSHVEPSKHYGYQSLDVLRQLHGTPAPNPASPASLPAPALSPWPNVLRLSAFALALVAAVALLSYARRRHSHRRSGHRPIHR